MGNSFIQQKTQALTQQYMEELGTLTEAQLDAVQNIQSFVAVIGIVVGIILAAVYWVGKSFVFHAFAKVLGGVKPEISSTIHLIAYTYLPFIFKGILDVYRGYSYQAPSYQEFVYQLEHPDILLSFIREHNIFLVWALVLMVIAVKEQYNLSWKRAFLSVFIPYTVVWIVQIAMTFAGTQLIGGM
ncbi:MAG: hypothetical protein AYK18_15270 [Theionarchaea archaeon DG-70]|nr:MAG: hypothetical protein AYK18_15270 [Theionarchaea archaeon DG-70]